MSVVSIINIFVENVWKREIMNKKEFWKLARNYNGLLFEKWEFFGLSDCSICNSDTICLILPISRPEQNTIKTVSICEKCFGDDNE